VIWLRLHVGGQRWTVHLVSPKSKHLEGDHVGRCIYERCAIYIDKTVGEGAREDTLLHELLHAVLFVSGAEKVYGADPKKDEALVAALTPVLHRLLKDLGFVFPKGVVE
jgi:hypothetical protein